MQLIRKNYPVTVAWLAYIFLAWFLKLLLVLGMVWSSQKFFPQSSWGTYSPLAAMIFIVAEYVGFATSVKWIAVPISLLAKIIAAKPKPSVLVLDWLSFAYYFVLLCFPLLLINAFPGFTVTGFPYLVPISKEVADVIGFVWKYIVSFFVYHKIVGSYLKEESQPASTKEIQATISG